MPLATNRLLKKSIRGLFQHAKQKARFLLCFIFQTLSVSEKWRYVPIPHRRVMFITLLILFLTKTARIRPFPASGPDFAPIVQRCGKGKPIYASRGVGVRALLAL